MFEFLLTVLLLGNVSSTPPMTLTVQGPQRVVDRQTIEVFVKVTPAPELRAPISIRIVTPEHVQLIGPIPMQELVPSGSPMLLRYILRVDKVPEVQDLQIIGEVRTSSFGARAEARYRFGRPEPKRPSLRPPVKMSPSSVTRATGRFGRSRR